MDSSTPIRRDRERREEEEVANRPDSRASGEFDATVRFPPLDPSRLQSRTEPRDYASLSSAARQIAAARILPFALSTQTSSFEVLQPSRPLTYRTHAQLARFDRRSSPTPQSAAEFTDPGATPAPCPTRRRRCRIDRWRTRANRNAAGRPGRYAFSRADCGLLIDVEPLRGSARCCPVDAVASSAPAKRTQRTRCRCYELPSLRCAECTRLSLQDAIARRCVRAAARCAATEAAVIRVASRSHSPNNRRPRRAPISSTTSAVRPCARRLNPVGSGRAGRADASRAVPVDTGCTTSADARCAVPLESDCTSSADSRCAVPVDIGCANRAVARRMKPVARADNGGICRATPGRVVPSARFRYECEGRCSHARRSHVRIR